MSRYRKHLLILICLFFIIPFFITLKTDFYFRFANYDNEYEFNEIDLLMEIDNNVVFKDTVTYHAFIPVKIAYPMKFGFHKVRISSSIANTERQKIISLFFNQYLMVEFYPRSKIITPEGITKTRQVFTISTYFYPYYY